MLLPFFIDLVPEDKVYDFWEGSFQSYSFPWLLTPWSPMWSLFPPFTIISILSWAQGQQGHWRSEQQHPGGSHGISFFQLWRNLRTFLCKTKNNITFERHGLNTCHPYMICHLGLSQPFWFKGWSSPSIENHKLGYLGRDGEVEWEISLQTASTELLIFYF